MLTTLQIRNCRLVSLLDLDLSKPCVLCKIATFLNRLIEIGVAGFRIDAAKHMWPAELQLILNGVKNLNTDAGFPANTRPFVYNEASYCNFYLSKIISITDLKLWSYDMSHFYVADSDTVAFINSYRWIISDCIFYLTPSLDRMLHGLAPPYLNQLVRVAFLPWRRRLQSASSNQLLMPPFRLTTVGRRTFPVTASLLWNSLPSDIQAFSSSSAFRQRLKTFIFANLFRTCSFGHATPSWSMQ